jgi:carbon dioxide concentrating mechanism protein CcmM
MSEGQPKGGMQPIGYMPMPGSNLPAGGGNLGRSLNEPDAAGRDAFAAEAPTKVAPASTPVAAAPQSQAPVVSRTVRLGLGAYVSPTASVLGDVQLGAEVFVAPGASIRGDTGARIVIGDGSNVQDGVVIHAAEARLIKVDGQTYAVWVGRNVSLAHQAFVHGPVAIGDGAFIGFRAMVVNSTIGRGSMVWHGAFVSDVEIPEGRLVPAGAIVDTPERARSLGPVTSQLREFAAGVVKSNQRYAQEYREGRRG